MEKLNGLVHKLDETHGSIQCHTLTIYDVAKMYRRLEEDMLLLESGDNRYRIYDINRTMRVLTRLLAYSVDELVKDVEEFGEIHDIISEIVKQKSLNHSDQ